MKNPIVQNPKKHISHTILFICMVVFLAIVMGVLSSKGFTIPDMKTSTAIICQVLFVVYALLLLFACLSELRYQGWQRIHLLPLAAVCIGTAAIFYSSEQVPFEQFARGSGHFFITYGLALEIIQTVLLVRKNKQAEPMKRPMNPDGVELEGAFYTDVTEKKAKPAKIQTEEKQEEVKEDSTLETPNEEKAPEKELDWKDALARSLALTSFPLGWNYYVSDQFDKMYVFEKESNSFKACGQEGYPTLNTLIHNDDRSRISEWFETCTTGDIGARVWNQVKKDYVASIIKMDKHASFEGIKVFLVVDVSAGAERHEEMYNDLKEALKETQEQVRLLEDDEKRVFYATNELMSALVESKSEESYIHNTSVRSFATLILKTAMRLYPELGFDDKMINDISNATTLHDIGKILVPDSILKKEGKLTKDEFEIMKKHPLYGAEIINKLPYVRNEEETMKMAREIALHHHERVDGKGYPDGLKEKDIPLYVQAVSLADVYEALTARRSYKGPYTHEKACEMIHNGECGAFSEKILRCFDAAAPLMKELRESRKVDIK